MGKAYKFSIVIGWLITAMAILIVVPMIVPDQNRSDHFWYRIIWTEILCLLLWGSSYTYIFFSTAQKDSVLGFGGIIPTVSMATSTYAIMSFSLMIGHPFISEGEAINRWHLILQIILFACTVLIVVFLSISRISASSNIGFDRVKARTPKDLHDLIAAHGHYLTNPLAESLRISVKQLRESILYSLNESNELSENDSYLSICQDIESFCESIIHLTNNDDAQLHQFTSLKDEATSLGTRISMISSQQIKR